jgi:WD40 repeat protein
LDSGGHSGFIRNVFIVPAMFKLSDQAFAVLKNSNVPESVLTKLSPLKNKDFPKADLMVEINKVLSNDEMKQFKTLIVSNATTPVGERVITVAEDKAVRIWDIKSGTTINTVRLPAGQGDEGALQAAALSPKGNRLAVGGIALKTAKVNAFPIFIINVETGALIKTINTAHNEVQSLHYSNDGERLAAGFLNGTVQVFNANSGAQVGRSDPPSINPIMEVRFNPNPTSKSQVLAILYANSNLRIVDLGNPSRATTLNVGDLKPITIAWSNEGKYLAVGGQTGDIRIYDYAGGTPARNIAKRMQKGLPVAISQIQFLAGDREFVYGGTNSWAGVIDRDTGKLKAEFTSHSNTIDAVCCSVDGKTIATSGGNQHETYVWDAANGNIIARLSGAGKGIWGIGW